MTATETIDNAPRVDYPAARSLDTGGWSETSGFKIALYLVPAGEREDDRPRVAVHSGVGNIGTPMPAWHGRWTAIGSYGADVIGESVLETLKSIESELLATSATYLGSKRDGSNHRGKWAGDEYLERCAIEHAWERAAEELRRYWAAGDYYAPAGLTAWSDFSDNDPTDAEIEAVIAACESDADDDSEAEVSGIDEYIRSLAEERREEMADE